MTNKLLLTPFETGLVVAVGILVLIFAYLLFGKLFYILKEKLVDNKSKKTVKKALEESGEVASNKEEKPQEKKNDKYTEILEKVHQNREQYFKEIDPVKESKTNGGSASAGLNQFENFAENDNNSDFIPEDFDVLEKIDFSDENAFDFDGMDNQISPMPNFAEDEGFSPQPANLFASQFKRNRMIKRNQTIGGEINSCSNRIKAIIALDILNKTKF